MARPVWNGTVSFGLLNVPVQVHLGERSVDLHFRLLDSRISSRGLDMAAPLVHSMSTQWQASDYRDDFRDKPSRINGKHIARHAPAAASRSRSVHSEAERARAPRTAAKAARRAVTAHERKIFFKAGDTRGAIGRSCDESRREFASMGRAEHRQSMEIRS